MANVRKSRGSGGAIRVVRAIDPVTYPFTYTFGGPAVDYICTKFPPRRDRDITNTNFRAIVGGKGGGISTKIDISKHEN